METYRIKHLTTVGLACMMFALGIYAQDNTVTRNIERSFAINEETSLEIDNVYGNVNIMNHNESTILIDVVVQVNLRDKSRAEEMLDMVNISIVEENNIIKAETSISDNINRIFRGFNIGGGGLEINYSIHMPPDIPVKLENKYGNVFIDELTSTSSIDVKYGKLNANRIIHNSQEPLSKIILAYSDAVIQEASWLNADIKYSKINITNSKALVILSKYSKVFVTNGSSIVSDSKYDTFELGALSNFVITTAYSNIIIDKLSTRLQVESKYTDVRVSEIPAGFESIKVNSSYGNYRLGIDPGASYRLEGYAKHSDIDYPENNARVNRVSENNELKVDGTVGTNQNTKSEVSVSSTDVNVKLEL